jgi:hypothetical protein
VRRLLARRRFLPTVPLLVATVGSVSGAACRDSEEDADLLPPVGWSPTPPVVTSPVGRARFGTGWYAIESNAHENWRWMGQVGEIHVPSIRAKGHLEFFGWAPLELLATPPVMEISFNGHKIDRFVPPKGRFKKAYDVPEEFQRDQSDSIVRLETSATAIPPGDPRALGFSLVSLTWTTAP